MILIFTRIFLAPLEIVTTTNEMHKYFTLWWHKTTVIRYVIKKFMILRVLHWNYIGIMKTYSYTKYFINMFAFNLI